MGRKSINEMGNRYGRLLVIAEAGSNSKQQKKWKCRCDCGKEIIVVGTRLRKGLKTDCGCVSRKHGYINEIGHRYGLLTVLEMDLSPNVKSNRCIRWVCQCDCGNKTIVSGDSLRKGDTKSCGCLKSIGEAKITRILQEYNINFKQQYSFDNLYSSKKGKPRFDFAIFDDNNKNLIFLLEYQGRQHYQNIPNFGERQREETDALKKTYCQNNHINLYEINYNDDIKERLKEILLRHQLISI